MAQGNKDAPAGRMQQFRFSVVGPDGKALLSEAVQVFAPAPPEVQHGAEPAGFRVSAIYVAARGKKLGLLKSELPGKEESQHQIAALSLDYQVLSPRDLQTGQASGKRQHSPLTIVKEWGAATPQLFQALVTNEVLETVDIECHGTKEDGTEGIVHKLKLKTAHVSSIKQHAGGQPDPRQLEAVSFVFAEIEHLSPEEDVLASDAWSS